MRRLRILSSCALLIACAASTVRADWPAAGDTLYADSHGASPPMFLAPDGAGVVAWWPHGANGPNILRSKRVTTDGEVLAHWDENPLNTPGTAIGAADGLGGLFKVWRDRTGSGGCSPADTVTVYLQHVLTSGSPDPAWGGYFGMRVMSSTFCILPSPAVTQDGAGGAFVAYTLTRPNGTTDVDVRRVLASGALAPGFPAPGLRVNDTSWQFSLSKPVIGSDGAGGVYVAFLSTYAGVTNPNVVRVDGSGAFPSPWALGGVSFNRDGDGTGSTLLGLFPSSGDAQLLCWVDQGGGMSRAWLQRFESDGTVSAGWPDNGLLIASAAGLGQTTVSTDGLGGAVFAWVDGSGVARGVRVLPSGAVAAGWQISGGVPLLDAGAVLGGGPMLASGTAGGMIVCWTDGRRPGHALVRARWLLGDGTPDPTVSDSGLVICPETSNGVVMGAISDGANGAYVGWKDGVPVWWYVMLSHVVHPTPTGVTPKTHPTALVLAAPWPNPARDALNVRLSLQTAAPARLELLDLAGRRVRARTLEGAGDRVERFDGLGDLASGAYIVRITQGGSTRAARVALIH